MDTPVSPPLSPQDPPSADAPKKYIRTFEADMKSVQEKGTADWTPIAGPVSKEATEAPAPTVPSGPASPLSTIASLTTAPATLEAPPFTPPGMPELGRPARVETYASDFSDRMKATGASGASIIAAEQDAGPVPLAVPRDTAAGESRANVWYITGGALLLVLGALGAYFGYTQYLAGSALVAVAPTPSTPIFVDERTDIAGTGRALTQALRAAVAKPLAPSAVRQLLYATSSDAAVFSALDASVPPEIVRNIRASGSMAGVVNVNGSQTPFFILSVASYGTTFAGMLAWEPGMLQALAELYPSYPAQVIATTTATTTAPRFTPGFRDEVVANHDARVYRDEQGRSVLIYGYWDQATLVVARDPQAFAEILGRLATSHS